MSCGYRGRVAASLHQTALGLWIRAGAARCSLHVTRLTLLAGMVVGIWMPRLAASPAIDRFVLDEMELNKIPGLALAIVQEGEISLVRAYGVRSVETRLPMTVNTPVNLASLSKALTALAIVRAEREGLIERSSKIAEVLPGLSGPGWAEVTLNHLLQHRSGLRRRHDFLLPCCESPIELDPALAVESLNAADLVGVPDESMSYANSNYVLLAAVIEQTSGIPFSAYMRQRVFLPLGMRNTSLAESDLVNETGAMPHEWQWGRVRVSRSRFRGWSGSSQVKSSAADMASYLELLVNPRPGEFEFLHGDAPWWSRLETEYDLGWSTQRDPDWLNEELVLEHTGRIWGGDTAAIVAPLSRSAVAVLNNLGVARSQAIARAILRSLDGTSLPLAAKANRTEIPDTWAIACLAAAIGLGGLASWLGWLTIRQIQSGSREWQPTALRVGRSAILGALCIELIHQYYWGATPPAAFPTTIRIALPLLVTCVLAVLLAAAVRGLTAATTRLRGATSP